MKICTMNFPEENIFLCVKFLLFFHVISYNFLYTPTKLHLLITSKKHNVNAQIPNNGKIVKKKMFLKISKYFNLYFVYCGQYNNWYSNSFIKRMDTQYFTRMQEYMLNEN